MYAFAKVSTQLLYLALIAGFGFRLGASGWVDGAATSGLLSSSILGLIAWKLLTSDGSKLHGIAPIVPLVGAIASIPLIPNQSHIPSCLSCEPTTTLALVGAAFSLAVHLLAFGALLMDPRYSRIPLAVLAVVGITGQAWLLWREPKFCPFCVVSGACLLFYLRQLGTELDALRLRPHPAFVVTLLIFCSISSALRFAFVGQAPRTGSTALERSPLSAIVQGPLPKSRFVFLAAEWCDACKEIPSRTQQARMEATTLWGCQDSAEATGCYRATNKVTIFPTLLVISKTGLVEKQVTGLPSVRILADLVSEFSEEVR